MKKCPKCSHSVDTYSHHYCQMCGAKMIHDPAYKQVLVKVEKYSDPKKLGFKHAGINGIRPDEIVEVWSVPFVEEEPTLPMDLIQGHNAFYQDQGHDWAVHAIAGEYQLKYGGADCGDEFIYLVMVVKNGS